MNKKRVLAVLILIIGICFMGIYIYKKTNTLILQGEVEVKSVDLSSKVTGRVQKINIKKGDKVKKGDVLLILDTPEIQAKADQTAATLALAMAQQEKASNGARVEQRQMALNQLNLAKKTYDRINRLHKEGVVPTQKLDEAYAQYKSAQDAYNMTASARYEDKLSASANVQRAKGAISEVSSYLKENSIVSPIDGEITELTVDEGELVGAGYPIITVADNTDSWVTFNMREDLLSKIKMDKEFFVKIPALDNQKIKVKVNYISVLGNFATWRATKAKGDFDMKTFEVRAVPVEPISDLRAGMSAITDWEKIK